MMCYQVVIFARCRKPKDHRKGFDDKNKKHMKIKHLRFDFQGRKTWNPINEKVHL